MWTAASTLVKIGAGLLVGKLLAVSFGPAGLGLAANFRQLITVLGVLAGAGIFNGVTKYVAQYHDNPQQLRRVVGTSSAMVLGFSTLMALVFVLAAAPISQGLFGNTDYQGLVRLVALVQMGIAWGNLLLALMKGFRDAAGNALSLIVGSLIGVLAYYVSYRLGGYEGALLGLALIPALVVIPAAIMLIKRGVIPLSYLKPSWDNGLAGQLSKFTLMALITSVTLPVAYIMMRKLLAAQYSWDEVGIWQGVSSISDAYLQFITASFSVYLLPTLSRLTEKRDITREVVKSLKFVLPLPDDTLVCCAHEYTLSNMKFALSILPHDLSINDYYRKVKELRAKNQITLPVILKNERQINVFLRTEDIDLINVINEETLLQQPEERFAWLRSKKDRF